MKKLMSDTKKKKINHVAIIPDGNRRWAQERGLSPWKGHEKGAEIFREIIQEAFDQKISYFTIWISSKDNLTKRSKKEITFLFRLFIKYFKELLRSELIKKDCVKVQILGNWQSVVPPKLEEILNKIIRKTSKFNKYYLTFLLNYDGRNDVLNAVKELQDIPPEKINIQTVHDHLITSSLPPVDLVIRTGGEPHNSAGFLMWQTAYSQYYFTDIFLPAFDKTEFRKALNNYFMRQRRFGK